MIKNVYMYKVQVEQPVLVIGAEIICAKVLRCPLPHTPNADLVPTLYGNK